MKQAQIPYLPIAEDTTFAELPEVLEFFIRHFAAQPESPPPLYIFEPLPNWHGGQPPALSEAPLELILVALDEPARATCLMALKEPHEREPKYSARHFEESVRVDETTSLKSVSAQMAKMPSSIFSLKIPIDPSQSISIFFLRTPATVGAFRRAIA